MASRKPGKTRPPSDAEIVPFPAPAKATGPARAVPPAPRADNSVTGDEIEPLSTRALIGTGLFILLLVLSGVWLMETMRENGIREDCLMQGRKNCAPIVATGRNR